MSTTYPDYPHTHFPDELTDEARGYKQDVKDVQTAQLIQEYQTQFTLGNTGKCHDILVANPELQEMMWKADDYNWIRDAIMALERFYSEDVTATMEQMAATKAGFRDDIQPGQSGDRYNGYSINKINSLFEELRHEYRVDLTASAWEGTGPFSQTVTNIPGLRADRSYERFSALTGTEEVANQKAYMKAMGFITGGETSDNSVTIYAYKKPDISFSIILREA